MEVPFAGGERYPRNSAAAQTRRESDASLPGLSGELTQLIAASNPPRIRPSEMGAQYFRGGVPHPIVT
jgi:hypothetical protein